MDDLSVGEKSSIVSEKSDVPQCVENIPVKCQYAKVMNCFSLSIAILSCIFVIVLTWQIIQVQQIKKDVLSSVKIELVKELENERLITSQINIDIYNQIINALSLSTFQSYMLYEHLFSLGMRLEDYEFAIIQLSNVIDIRSGIEIDGSNITEPPNLPNLSILIKTLTSKQIKISNSVIDKFIKSVHIAESKGYSSDSLTTIKNLLYSINHR